MADKITRLQSAAPIPVPDEESLLEQVGRVSLSGISKLGNFLDLPGSMVRDTLVWDNPFDQFLSPLSHYQTGASATGRDVLARNLLTGSSSRRTKRPGFPMGE